MDELVLNQKAWATIRSRHDPCLCIVGAAGFYAGAFLLKEVDDTCLTWPVSSLPEPPNLSPATTSSKLLQYNL